MSTETIIVLCILNYEFTDFDNFNDFEEDSDDSNFDYCYLEAI